MEEKIIALFKAKGAMKAGEVASERPYRCQRVDRQSNQRIGESRQSGITQTLLLRYCQIISAKF